MTGVQTCALPISRTFGQGLTVQRNRLDVDLTRLNRIGQRRDGSQFFQRCAVTTFARHLLGKSVPCPIVFVDSPGSNFWNTWQDYVKNHLLKQGLISPEDLHLYKITSSVEEAAEEVKHFYSNYHSLRYAREDVVMRLHRKPTEEQVAYINDNWPDIKRGGKFSVSTALPVERDEPALKDLHRLIFNFNRKDHGRLRMLIDYLNGLPE